MILINLLVVLLVWLAVVVGTLYGYDKLTKSRRPQGCMGFVLWVIVFLFTLFFSSIFTGLILCYCWIMASFALFVGVYIKKAKVCAAIAGAIIVASIVFKITNFIPDIISSGLKHGYKAAKPHIKTTVLAKLNEYGLYDTSDRDYLNWLESKAVNGNSYSQYMLGLHYANEIGAKKNYPEAVKWYKLAANRGHAEAQNNLGVCYELGRGVEKNDAEAIKWYSLAAERGEVCALTNIGERYSTGRGVKQDLGKAIKLYTRAAEKGSAEAQYRLGLCYEKGKGVAANRAEAIEWYKLAAKQGNDEAQDAWERLK